MKITEIEFGTGKVYVDECGNNWVSHFSELVTTNKFGEDYFMNSIYPLKKILEMNFEEQVDWSKVEVDTPVFAKCGGVWNKRHFAKFENGKVYYFAGGATSWTNGDYTLVTAEEAKLGGAK